MSQSSHIPLRMCIFCRKRYPKDRLKRFVFKDGKIVEDVKKGFAGRGAYCCYDYNCIEKLEKYGNKALKRALKISQL